MADPDWDDPCAIAAWLKPQLHQVAVGNQIVTIRHDQVFTTYNQANLKDLMSLYRGAVSECASKTGSKTGRRRAFTAG